MKNANNRLALAGSGDALRLDPGVDASREIRPRARNVEDDFFCLRFSVWYPSFDCAFRTKFRTSPGCCDCQQGRFNFKRHASALREARFGFPFD